MLDSNIDRKLELIRQRVLVIGELYNTRVTIKEIANRHGMESEEVKIVLKFLGYWHGIDRFEEPTQSHAATLGCDIRELSFLLNYPI